MANKSISIKNFMGITADSREVKSGFIYVALKGVKTNGDDFIEEAINLGATLVVIDNNSLFDDKGANNIVRVKDPRKTLGKLANEFYQPQPDNIVAVTGTSGKTSVAYFYQQIAELLSLRSASIGTLGVISNAVSIALDDNLTSPDPITLNKTLHQLFKSGVTHVAMEASSHGIHQNRMKGVNIKAAAFTNLSQDHLDYHNTMDEYLEAKMALFTKMLKKGYAIINADIPEYEKINNSISSISNIKILTYGQLGNHIKLLSQKGQDITLEILGSKYTTSFTPEGNFQVYNLMAAIGLAIATQLKPYEIMQVIPKLKAAPGRLEKIGVYNDAKIFVDYSHKPDALEKALQALKNECLGKLHVIFGCGGDRDKFKRPNMGKIAAQHADFVIVTDDNPRTEDASIIRKSIMEACPKALEYDNRAAAIAETIKILKPKDILLIAGKGHETYQIIGNEKIHFSDSEEVVRTINNLSQAK